MKNGTIPVPMINDISLKGRVVTMEKEYLAKDGRKIPVLFPGSALWDENDSLRGIVCTAPAITERKQVEEALRKSEEEAKRVAHENAIIAGIGRIISSTLNIDEVYEHFAEEAHKLISFDRITVTIINLRDRTYTSIYRSGGEVAAHPTGYVSPLAGSTVELIMQRRAGLIIQAETEREVIDLYPDFSNVLRAEAQSKLSVPLISNDQVIGVLNFRSIKTNAYTKKDLRLAETIANQIAGAIANALLFLERKQAVEALRQSEEEATRLAHENAIIARIGRIISSTLNIDEVYERFAEEVHKLITFDRVMVSIINFDAHTHTSIYRSGVEVSGHPTGYVSPLAGTTTELVIKRKTGLIIQADNEREVVDLYADFSNVLRAGAQSKLTVPLISNDQVIGVLNFRSAKANAYTKRDLRLAETIANQIAGAIANALLFLERKRAEEELKSFAAKLEQSNLELQDFAYIASHDLQEPLRKITAFGDRLKAKFADKLDEQGLDYIERMRNAAIRMQALINGLLMYSRVTSKAQPLEEVKLSKIVREVLSDLEERIRKVEGRVEIGDLPSVQADPLQMRQLFQNLIGNALKFHTKEKVPLVHVTSQRIAIEQSSDGNGHGNMVWQLSVKDNGIGFDEKYLDRIFGVFQRLHGRDEYEGSGVGLSICRKIVTRHGGAITAKSATGLGAEFIFTLPAADNTK